MTLNSLMNWLDFYPKFRLSPRMKLPSNESAEIQAFSKLMKHIAKLRGARNTLLCFKSNQREAISASIMNY